MSGVVDVACPPTAFLSRALHLFASTNCNLPGVDNIGKPPSRDRRDGVVQQRPRGEHEHECAVARAAADDAADAAPIDIDEPRRGVAGRRRDGQRRRYRRCRLRRMRDVASSGSRRSGLHSGRRREKERRVKNFKEKKTEIVFQFQK